MVAADPVERRLQATLASNTRWSREDVNSPERRAALQRARAASPQSVDYFLARTDPELPDDERLRQATAARKAHYAGMALKSLKARRTRKRKTIVGGES